MKLYFYKILSQTGLRGLFLFLLFVAQVEAQTDLSNQQDPRALYDRMVESKHVYDFRGTLTYEQAGQLQSFEVDSHYSGVTVDQKLSLLDGPLSEHFMRFDADCEKAASAKSARLNGYYNFYMRGETRVAGFNGVEIVLSPVDKYRNGFQFVIEKESGLMLRSIALTPDRRVVERIQFVSLDFDLRELMDEVALAEEEPVPELSAPAGGASTEVVSDYLNAVDETDGNESKEPKAISCDRLSIETGWSAGWLPEGFELLNSRFDDDRAVLVYSDGLSVFSIFIESVLDSFLPPSNAHRGATTVYINYLSSPSSTFLVSIVGEIPLATAERVLPSLRQN